MRRFLAAVTIGLSLLAFPARGQEPVTVFAAASLKTALDDIGAAWSQESGNAATISYAGSSALARQIEEGAPADLFIPADLDWMAYLAERDLVDAASERRFLGNRIVLVAPADSTVDLSIGPGFDLAAALGDGRLAMANVDAVPAGRYGKAALESLGVWDDVAGKVAQAENVRAALQFVTLGEAPFGIVYRTDATAEPGVRVVGTFPEDSHDPIIYPAALTADSANPDAAAFLDYLQGDIARAIFAEQGFTVLAGD
ncbi:molybdate ABC transporter substrate-binding protein [Mesorhizobium sp. YIM 152430]|uniref:molybdate ABC transporter substrate-binding protein n=1 Tax=Mesorhizobium sp. YIM 152430 TaxID=3031761 RepID=UPI0023DBA540|nr:molybdate ABC transporter substrate-binding protein [Mesorhizobium sp. YIM 152430]MDF1600706.1 molybdate ABC transporter substrate-binding protein [Mesorhizobium sp. YIM 152430]